ncbi:MAG: hypothetical protein QNJ32_13115 [Xenococcaceae cyanobacterium MO_167.B27]|nr:hypothetical protein [Xenococcaceae cyanobacterium MO_167.B27]
MKQLVPIIVCLWFWLIAPAILNASTVEEETNSQIQEQLVQPQETYHLLVLAEANDKFLEYEVTAPVVKFWGENLSETQVRLQIDVYHTVPIEIIE